MKKRTAMVLLAFVFCCTCWSQLTEGKNMAKVNLSAFAGKGFGLQYERQVGKRITVALGYSAIPASSIAFKSFIENQINNDQAKAAVVDIKNFSLGTSIFTPEARYYFGRDGSFHGLYLAPYVRFGHYNLEGPITYTTSTGARRDVFFNGSLNATTGGLMMGSTFHLSKRLYLDWWIIGASIGGASGNFVAKTELSSTEQQSLKSQLDNLDIKFTNIKSEVNGSGATVASSGSIAGVRGLGFNVGIRF